MFLIDDVIKNQTGGANDVTPVPAVIYQRIDVNFALRLTTWLHLTLSNDQGLVPDMITVLPSKCMTSGYNCGSLITSWRERAHPYAAKADFGCASFVDRYSC